MTWSQEEQRERETDGKNIGRIIQVGFLLLAIAESVFVRLSKCGEGEQKRRVRWFGGVGES